MISCDDREPKSPNSIVDFIQERGVEAEFERLTVGDYLMFDRDEALTLVTRKAGDLLQSTFSGHFSEELDGCLEMIDSYGGGRLFFLLEGPWATYQSGLAHFKRRGPDWFKQFQVHSCDRTVLPNLEISLQTAGLFVVHTTSLSETADALVAIYQRGQEGWPTKLARTIKRPELRWSNDNRVSRLMALCPQLPEKVAVELLANHIDIGNIVDLARSTDGPKKDNPLLATPKFGITLLKNLQETLK